MKNSKKQAKFFCEFCGSEVPRKAKTCPKCGKFFASVMCPKCAHTGSTDEFKNGCPKCGYAVPGSGTKKKTNNIKFYDPSNLGSKSGPQFYNAAANNNNSGKKIFNLESSLPLWVYVVVVVTLIILVIMLYSCL